MGIANLKMSRMGRNSMSFIRAKPGDRTKILDSSHSYILDDEYYVAFKVVFDKFGNIKIFPATEESQKELNEQPRNREDYLINKYWEIMYEEQPWLQVDNFLLNNWVRNRIKNGINNIRFATENFGIWNILHPTNPCPKFYGCKDGSDTCKCVINSCNCEFGIAVPDGQCHVHNSNQCASCDQGTSTRAGYHLNQQTESCEINVCRCNEGDPRIFCSQHDNFECENCYSSTKFSNLINFRCTTCGSDSPCKNNEICEVENNLIVCKDYCSNDNPCSSLEYCLVKDNAIVCKPRVLCSDYETGVGTWTKPDWSFKQCRQQTTLYFQSKSIQIYFSQQQHIHCFGELRQRLHSICQSPGCHSY